MNRYGYRIAPGDFATPRHYTQQKNRRAKKRRSHRRANRERGTACDPQRHVAGRAECTPMENAGWRKVKRTATKKTDTRAEMPGESRRMWLKVRRRGQTVFMPLALIRQEEEIGVPGVGDCGINLNSLSQHQESDNCKLRETLAYSGKAPQSETSSHESNNGDDSEALESKRSHFWNERFSHIFVLFQYYAHLS